MDLGQEIELFDERSELLSSFIDIIATFDDDPPRPEHIFLAEAVMFRLFRIYERLARASFLYFCVNDTTISGALVTSKLKCADLETAEGILKSGNKYLDWGNVDTLRKLGNLVFDKGFPIVDLVSPIASSLKDLQRFRNYVAHDSHEAWSGFKKSRTQYVRIGDVMPESVGELSLYRRNAKDDVAIRILHGKVSSLTTILKSL